MPLTRESITRIADLPLEEVPCYLCGKDDSDVVVNDPPFMVRICRLCGLGFTSPRVQGSRIHEIYSEGYFSSDRAERFGYAAYANDLDAYLRTFRRKAKVIQRYKPAGSVLEVGCAGGAFLEVMRSLGYAITGIEVSAEILEIARARFNLQGLHEGRLDTVPLPVGSFDIVALFDVIEHVTDPVRELVRCHDLLKDDGILVLQTQNIASFTRRLLGTHWPHFKQIEHIYHFSPATIREVLRRAGFTIALNTRRHAGKYVSFDDLADRAHRVAHLPRLFCGPLRALGRRALYINPLDEMLVVARKSDKAPLRGG